MHRIPSLPTSVLGAATIYFKHTVTERGSAYITVNQGRYSTVLYVRGGMDMLAGGRATVCSCRDLLMKLSFNFTMSSRRFDVKT